MQLAGARPEPTRSRPGKARTGRARVPPVPRAQHQLRRIAGQRRRARRRPRSRRRCPAYAQRPARAVAAAAFGPLPASRRYRPASSGPQARGGARRRRAAAAARSSPGARRLAVTDLQRARINDEALRIRLRLAVVAVHRVVLARRATAHRDHDPRWAATWAGALLRGQHDGQAAHARIALRIAEELLEDREHVAIAAPRQRLRGHATRSQGRLWEDLRRRQRAGARLPGHLARRRRARMVALPAGVVTCRAPSAYAVTSTRVGPRAQVADRPRATAAAPSPSPPAPRCDDGCAPASSVSRLARRAARAPCRCAMPRSDWPASAAPRRRRTAAARLRRIAGQGDDLLPPALADSAAASVGDACSRAAARLERRADAATATGCRAHRRPASTRGDRRGLVMTSTRAVPRSYARARGRRLVVRRVRTAV